MCKIWLNACLTWCFKMCYILMHWKNLVKMLSIKCLQLYFMSVYVFWCGAALTKTLGRIKWIEWIEWCMNSVNMFATAFSPHYKRLVFRLSEWFPSGRSMCMSCLQVFVNSCSNCAGCIFFLGCTLWECCMLSRFRTYMAVSTYSWCAKHAICQHI